MGDGQEGRGALPVQILQQLVHVQDERVLARHGGLITVQAVDNDGPDAVDLDALAHSVGELARRQFGCVDLLDEQPALVDHRLQVDAEADSPVE